jgi:O-methyltransferase
MLLQIKKYVKKVFMLLERFLPQTFFDKLSNYLFPVYKDLVRLGYYIKNMPILLFGSQEYKKMILEICKVMPYTLVGTGGLEATYKLAKEVNNKGIGGHFVELGVARGGCAALMGEFAFERSNRIDRQLWLFDSFEGLPDPTKEDFDRVDTRQTGNHVRPLLRGSCLGTIDEVQSLMLNKFHFPKDRVFFVKGWFQDTLPLKGKDVGNIAVLRIDGDWYESTKCCLEYMYKQVVHGGAVIIDDYLSCYGCKKAVDEFIINHNIKADIKLDGRGGCYFIKQ